MKIEIHDVDHGSCAVVTGPGGHRLMLDCGYSLSRPWFPSVAYRGQTIQNLMFLNLDEDHVQDLPSLADQVIIRGLYSNPTVDAGALYKLKQGSMGAGVRTAHRLLSWYGPGGVGEWQHDLGGVRWHAFHNRYRVDFDDTNNLSLAVFVTYAGYTVLFGGDMERSGWLKLLESPAFRDRLTEVKIYVASHHGRDNGCCAELFNYMMPDVVIISDCEKKHGTQETTDWYGRRVRGIVDDGRPATATGPAKKRVMTTRSNGSMLIDVSSSGGAMIYYEKNVPSVAELVALMFPAKTPIGALTSGLP